MKTFLAQLDDKLFFRMEQKRAGNEKPKKSYFLLLVVSVSIMSLSLSLCELKYVSSLSIVISRDSL